MDTELDNSQNLLFQKDAMLRFCNLSAQLCCAVKKEGPWSLVVVQTMTQYLLLLYTSSKFLLLSCTVKKHELVITENYVYIQQNNF